MSKVSRAPVMSRWDELTKQPTAKFIHIYNQTDEYDNKGKRILISDRRTPDFEHFVDEVNDKLAPPGVGLRNIYTAQGGSQVRSVSALTVSKEYISSPGKFDKKFLKKVSSHSQPPSRKNSKKSSANSGHDSDGEFLKKKKAMPGRLSLMERQDQYARSRSPSEERPRARSVDHHDLPFTPSNRFPRHASNSSPQRKPSKSPVAKSRAPAPQRKPSKSPAAKPRAPQRKPLYPKTPPTKKFSSKTATSKKSSFNKKGYNNPALRVAGDSDDEREKTPPGKRRVAFKGQYLFITDDDDSEYESDSNKKSKTKPLRKSTKSIASKASSIYSQGSVYSKANKSKSNFSNKSGKSKGDSDDYSYDSDDKSNYSKSTKSTAKPGGKPSRPQTDKSRITEESDEYSGSEYSGDESRKPTAKPAAKQGAYKNNLSPSNALNKSRTSRASTKTGKSRASTKTGKSKVSSKSGISKASSKTNDYSDSDYSGSDSGTRAASRVSKYSKYSKKTSKSASKSTNSGSGSYSGSYDSSPDRASRVTGRTGASRKSSVSGSSRASTGGSYSAKSRSNGARTVPDSAETKVNTPVDMKKAKEVSSNGSGSESYYSDYSDNDKKGKK